MYLTITTDAGNVVAQWEIELDFGDIRKPFPMQTMMDDVVSAYKRQKAKEVDADGVQSD